MKNRKRNRKSGFDYSTAAIYFLTICVQDRIHYFGQVENGEMKLNSDGEITARQIEWLEEQYPYFIIHNYIVMPNHIHILCEINGAANAGFNDPGSDDARSDDAGFDDAGFDDSVRTGRDLSPLSPQPRLKIKSISELMGAFKTTSSKQIHLAGNTDFKWQRSFHDIIVRDQRAYQNIFNYIDNNPAKWAEDTFNKSELNHEQ